MKGDNEVISYLNQVLRGELTAINQYFLHAKMMKDWGLERIAKHEHDESIDEMRHAEQLTERILFLEGMPNLQDLGRLRIGENVAEMLQGDLALEEEAVGILRNAIECAEGCRDFVSRDLFREILDAEEEHIDWLETQLQLIGKVGLENYLQSQIA